MAGPTTFLIFEIFGILSELCRSWVSDRSKTNWNPPGIRGVYHVRVARWDSKRGPYQTWQPACGICPRFHVALNPMKCQKGQGHMYMGTNGDMIPPPFEEMHFGRQASKRCILGGRFQTTGVFARHHKVAIITIIA